MQRGTVPGHAMAGRTTRSTSAVSRRRGIGQGIGAAGLHPIRTRCGVHRGAYRATSLMLTSCMSWVALGGFLMGRSVVFLGGVLYGRAYTLHALILRWDRGDFSECRCCFTSLRLCPSAYTPTRGSLRHSAVCVSRRVAPPRPEMGRVVDSRGRPDLASPP